MTTTPGVATDAPLRARVAEEIRVALTRKRMSAAALGRELGVSQTYVWRRLNGETAFDIDDLERIARLLGVRVIDLLPVDDEEQEGPEHKIRFARSASRPVDNRPVGGPRKSVDRDLNRRPQDDARRPQRIRALPAGTTTRRAA